MQKIIDKNNRKCIYKSESYKDIHTNNMLCDIARQS